MTILSNLIGRTAIAVLAGVHKSMVLETPDPPDYTVSYSGVARGEGLGGSSTPFLNKKKTIYLIFSKNIEIIRNTLDLSTKIGTYI